MVQAIKVHLWYSFFFPKIVKNTKNEKMLRNETNCIFGAYNGSETNETNKYVTFVKIGNYIYMYENTRMTGYKMHELGVMWLLLP